MADQLYLSYELRGFTAQNMIRHYEKLIRAFPFSRLSRVGAQLRINAISLAEPPLVEKAFADPVAEVEDILAVTREFLAGDCAAFLEADWDLWQYYGEWKLQPSRVTLACFGPEFESDGEDNLRIEFGIDAHFLPQPELPDHLFMVRSNVRSLLHLVHELDQRLATADRRLWTESRENFAERLQAALERSENSD
jgi:hypothetical protein